MHTVLNCEFREQKINLKNIQQPITRVVNKCNVLSGGSVDNQ